MQIVIYVEEHLHYDAMKYAILCSMNLMRNMSYQKYVPVRSHIIRHRFWLNSKVDKRAATVNPGTVYTSNKLQTQQTLKLLLNTKKMCYKRL